jgi:hypothetical protein
MTPSNSCGDCDLCCRLLAIEELGKAAGPLCDHYVGACAIYEDRPASCRGFRCQWLKSESLAPAFRMEPEWRPDRANLVIYTERGGMRLNVVVEPTDPFAWKREPYYGYIKRMSQRAAEGLEVVVFVDDRRIVIFPDDEIDLGPVKPEQEIVVGYTERGRRRIPYATVLDVPGHTASADAGA